MRLRAVRKRWLKPDREMNLAVLPKEYHSKSWLPIHSGHKPS